MVHENSNKITNMYYTDKKLILNNSEENNAKFPVGFFAI